MKAFKVLRKDKQGKYWSCVVTGKARVRYFTDRKINPPNFLKQKGYELLVFKSWRYAESFSPIGRLHSTKVIYEVEVGTPKRIPVRCYAFELSNGELVRSDCVWPAGTMMVPWVRLLPRRKR